jgi:hypothetical protein
VRETTVQSGPERVDQEARMNDVTKGFRDGRFLSLSERDKRDVLKLMARVAEEAYRRGAQQGAGLAQRPSFRADLGEWRYQPSIFLPGWTVPG